MMSLLSEFRDGQSVYAVIVGVRADEFHEGYLAAKIEGADHAEVAPGYLEADTFGVQHLGLGKGCLNIAGRGPHGCGRHPQPVFKRSAGSGVFCPELDNRSLCNDPHNTSLFPN
ncbi:hypothetical protein P8S53_02190 [Roseinatronobacter sp. S2]|nr:hypothetical protein P8S53_02190 [Roseinatronobacter sp. S2]